MQSCLRREEKERLTAEQVSYAAEWCWALAGLSALRACEACLREPPAAVEPTCLQRLHPQTQLLEHPWLHDDEVSNVPFDDTIVQRLQRYGLYGRREHESMHCWGADELWAGLLGRSALPPALTHAPTKLAHLPTLPLRRFRQRALIALLRDLAASAVDGGAGEPFADMRAAFQRMDSNADGLVTYAELKAALQNGHFSLSPREVEQLLEQVTGRERVDDGHCWL